MNRIIKKVCNSLMLICIMGLVLPAGMFSSYAAAPARISFSDPTATVGEEVKVTVKFATTDGSTLGNTDMMLAYDATMLEYINETENASGGAGAIRVWTAINGTSEVVTELRFIALQAGDTQITVTEWEGYDNDNQALNVEREGSSAVKIKPLATSSTDATLKRLQVSPGQLTPAFTPAVESYQMTVGIETDKVTLSADANNSNAKVSVEGNEGLQEGENTVICKVTAEDGVTAKTYTITVSKFAGGETAASSEGGNESQSEETDITDEPLFSITNSAKEYQILPLTDDFAIPKGFVKAKFQLGDIEGTGLVWGEEKEPSYIVFYGMNSEQEKGLYRYDRKELTIQRYFEDPAIAGSYSKEEYDKVATDFNDLIEDYAMRKYIIIVMAVVIVVLLILLVAASSRKGGNNGRSGSRSGGRGEGRSAGRSGETDSELKTYIPVSRSAARKLSKEEQYMLGEEEEYDEYDDLDLDFDMEHDIDLDQDMNQVLASTLITPDDASEQSHSYSAEEAQRNNDDDDDDFEILDL